MNNRVEFVSYDGKYPCLCSGNLVLKIDGEEVKFNKYKDEFWAVGGNWCDTKNRKPWIMNADRIPEKYRNLVDEISKVFNANVPFACCGGCR